MKREYGRWKVFLREMETCCNSPVLNERERASIKEVYEFAVNKGYTEPEQDIIATRIIKKYKIESF